MGLASRLYSKSKNRVSVECKISFDSVREASEFSQVCQLKGYEAGVYDDFFNDCHYVLVKQTWDMDEGEGRQNLIDKYLGE